MAKNDNRSISEDPKASNIEKKDETKAERAKSKISKALSIIPNQGLIKKSKNSKGIDPTNNIEI